MPVLTLIRTSPENVPGSMNVYANLVVNAIGQMPGKRFDLNICDFFDPNGGTAMARHHLWRFRHARQFFQHRPADLYHLLDGSMAGLMPAKIRRKTVATVHDFIPLLQTKGQLPGRVGLAGRFLVHRTLQSLKQVAGVAADSAHTADDLLRFTGRNDSIVTPIPVRPLPSTDEASRSTLPTPFLLHAGNNADYKNRRGVLAIFKQVQDIPDLHLVMAGPPPSRELKKAAESLSRVRFEVSPTDARLAALYRHAFAFLFPSLYEGFGMPVLEAMRFGCPVVCSNAASLPEIAGNAALLAAPMDTGRLADHCRRLWHDKALRADMIQRGNIHSEAFTLDRLTVSLHAWYKKHLEGAEEPA